MHEIGAHESNQLEEAVVCFRDLLQRAQQQEGDQRDGELGAHGVLGAAEEFGDLQRLLQRLEQLNDILPINALLKSRSTTATIRCVHRPSQWSGRTTFTTRLAMSCGAPTARRWPCRSG